MTIYYCSTDADSFAAFSVLSIPLFLWDFHPFEIKPIKLPFLRIWAAIMCLNSSTSTPGSVELCVSQIRCAKSENLSETSVKQPVLEYLTRYR